MYIEERNTTSRNVCSKICKHAVIIGIHNYYTICRKIVSLFGSVYLAIWRSLIRIRS